MSTDDRTETITAETDSPTVCITHGRFIPCRNEDWHHFTDNPYWVKSVRDFQGSDDPNLTWEPATLTITDPAEIRACDEPDERGDFPCCTTPAPVGDAVALDLDAIEARAKAVPNGWDRWADWHHYQILSLVTPTQIDGWAHPEKRADAMERTEAAVEHIVGMDPATTLALVAEVRYWQATAWARLEDFAAAEAEAGTLRARLAEAEALHWRVGGACSHCSQRSDYAVAWPCETAVALATTGEGE